MAGRIPDQVIDDINRKSDILDIVGAYVKLTRKGDRWWGLCPFHSEKSPSFSVSPDSNLFYCFGCQKGGGVFQFLMEIESLTFPEAAGRLAEKAGIEIPEDEGRGVAHRDSRKAIQDLYLRVAGMFRWLLLNHPGAEHAREYLRRRGIEEETAQIYMIGWAPADGEWLYRFLTGKKYSKEFLADSGLFSRKQPRWSYFVDRIIFPVMPDSERVVAFSGRSLSDRGPKYINSPETAIYQKSRHLYGYAQAKKSMRETRFAVLCEGNMDVLSCSQAGVTQIVAPLGTAFTLEQAKLIKRQAESVILMFDADDAGRKATMKAAIVSETAGLNVQAAVLPPGTDPADILLEQGPSALKKIVERPINIFSYLLNLKTGTRSDHSGEAQEEVLEELTPYLDAVGSEIRLEAYLRELAETIKADPNTVLREYRNLIGRKRNPAVRTPVNDSRDSKPIGVFGPAGDDLFLMAAVAVRTEYFTTLRNMLAPELLRDSRALSVYRALEELSGGGRTPRTDEVVELLEDENLRFYIIEKAAEGIYDLKAEQTIFEKVRLLRLRALSDERQELLNGMKGSGGADPEINIARIKRIQQIDQDILRIRQGEDGGN